MWIATISGSILFRIPRDTDNVLGLAFSIALYACNRRDYPIFRGERIDK
jgi:hypothetical protein